MTAEVENYLKEIRQNEKLDNWQRLQLQLGAQEGLTVEQLQFVARFNGAQQSEVRQGFADGLNYEQVMSYAKTQLPAAKMIEKRKSLLLEQNKGLSELLKEITKQLDESRALNKYLTDHYLKARDEELQELKKRNQELFEKNSELMKELMYLHSQNSQSSSNHPDSTLAEPDNKETPVAPQSDFRPTEKPIPEKPVTDNPVPEKPITAEIEEKPRPAISWRERLGLAKAMRRRRKAKEEANPGKVNQPQEPDIIQMISNPQYNVSQMAEISAGYKAGLPLAAIQQYANPQLAAEKMKEIRQLQMVIYSLAPAPPTAEETKLPSALPEGSTEGNGTENITVNEENSFVPEEEDGAFFMDEDE